MIHIYCLKNRVTNYTLYKYIITSIQASLYTKKTLPYNSPEGVASEGTVRGLNKSEKRPERERDAGTEREVGVGGGGVAFGA